MNKKCKKKKNKKKKKDGKRYTNHQTDLLRSFKEDEVEQRKASHANRDTTKVSTCGAPSPELHEVLQDTYF